MAGTRSRRRSARLVAVLAILVTVLSATQAQSAAATEPGLYAETSPVELQGSQSTEIELEVPGAGTIACSHVTFTGNLTGPIYWPSFTLSMHFTTCNAFGVATTHVDGTSCALQFTIVEVVVNRFRSLPHIECDSEKSLVITPTVFGFSACTITIGAQSPSGEVDLENQGSGSTRDVKMTFTITGISHSAGCGAEAASDGVLEGQMTLKGFSGETQNGIWLE